jgi:hypothetical protein
MGGIKMIKKLVAGAIVLTILGFSGIFIYANPVDVNNIINTTQSGEEIQQTVNSSFRVLSPWRDRITIDKKIILSLLAPEGTTVKIEVFYNTSIAANKENYVLSYDPIELRIGALQRGWAEVELKKGLNKIEFTAFLKNGLQEARTRIITVKDIDEMKRLVEQSIQNIGTTSSTDTLNRIVNIESML